MIKRRFEVIHLSDVHYGSANVTPQSITAGLERTLDINDESLSMVDLISVDGDFFDSMFMMSEDVSCAALRGIAHILRVADKYRIPVDVLEGTPKHDRKQNSHFQNQLEILGLNVELRWFTDITIRHLDSHGIDILYVPDAMGNSSQDVYGRCVELIHSRGLNTVAFAHMHCAWLYQMPVAHPSYFDSAQWANLVEYNIYSGHIHGHSRYLKNVSVGSFGRNFHGEEEPKGLLRCVYEPGKDPVIRQVVNPCARIFKTFTIDGMESQQVEAMIAEADLPDNSAVRLLHDNLPSIRTLIDLLRPVFPTFSFKEQKHKEVKPEQTSDILGDGDVVTAERFTSLTPENLPGMMESHMSDPKFDTGGFKVSELMETLRETLDE